MASRSQRAEIARETLAILERGRYVAPSGRAVSIRAELDAARAGTRLSTPGDFPSLMKRSTGRFADRRGGPPAAVEVTNETTLGTARRLAAGGRVLALNFASAKNPGGGFLNGSQAQEESLARASGLYACIEPQRGYYEANRLVPTCLYTDHMIYAPAVPVFRDDGDRLLEEPALVSFLTAPAVNAGAVRRNEPSNAGQILPVMRSRAEKVLAVAAHHGYETLVLGAWGCGVFQNDPGDVAALFAELLATDGPFGCAFNRITFAVLDRSPGGETFAAFARAIPKRR